MKPRATITIDDYACVCRDLSDRVRDGRDDIEITNPFGHPDAIERIERGKLPVFTIEGVPIFLDTVTANAPPVLAAMIARWLN